MRSEVDGTARSPCVLIPTCNMGDKDRVEGSWEQAKGRAKEVAGSDRRCEDRGGKAKRRRLPAKFRRR